MRCDLKEPGAGTQALGGEGNRAESWYRNWSWCISALPSRERGTHSCIQGLDGVPAHWKCHHSSTTDLHEIRERVRPDCRGREARLLNAYIKVFRLVFSRCGCGRESRWNFKCNGCARATLDWSLIVFENRTSALWGLIWTKTKSCHDWVPGTPSHSLVCRVHELKGH